jgi:hypothetical protein
MVATIGKRELAQVLQIKRPFPEEPFAQLPAPVPSAGKINQN